MPRLEAIVINCREPAALASFYAGLLGLAVSPQDDAAITAGTLSEDGLGARSSLHRSRRSAQLIELTAQASLPCIRRQCVRVSKEAGCGARAAVAGPPRLPEPLQVKRRVSVRGAIMIGGQRIQIGLPHAGKTVQITVGSDTYQITAGPGITITAPRATSRDIKRHKASDYQPG